MKLVIFAHVPPPHHGQSQMVKLILDGLGKDASHRAAGASPHSGAECFHVNCRISRDLEDIGRARAGKFPLLIRYCFQAILLRWRQGADHFYFIPATGCRLGMLRDWIIMALCRPFFRKMIFHWEATGLGEWVQSEARFWERWVSRLLLFRPDLSIVLSNWSRRDAEAMHSRRVAVVPNGLPDPCPAFEAEVLPRRLARSAARLQEPVRSPPRHVYSVLFMSLCCREKGLFDAVEAVTLANRKLSEAGSSVRVQLSVAGTFWHTGERAEFDARVSKPDLELELAVAPGATGALERQRAVRYLGFVEGENKRRLLIESDCFCFPTYYPAESFGMVLLEAMAFGLPVIATRWHSIPELLPPGYPGLVQPRNPQELAEALLAQIQVSADLGLRARFLELYTREKFLENFAAALTGLGRH